jgi:hypothetical protein
MQANVAELLHQAILSVKLFYLGDILSLDKCSLMGVTFGSFSCRGLYSCQ